MDDNPYQSPLEIESAKRRWEPEPGWFWRPFHPSTPAMVTVILSLLVLAVFLIIYSK